MSEEEQWVKLTESIESIYAAVKNKLLLSLPFPREYCKVYPLNLSSYTSFQMSNHAEPLLSYFALLNVPQFQWQTGLDCRQASLAPALSDYTAMLL